MDGDGTRWREDGTEDGAAQGRVWSQGLVVWPDPNLIPGLHSPDLGHIRVLRLDPAKQKANLRRPIGPGGARRNIPLALW